MSALLLGTAFSAIAGEFALPAEGPVAFRRDKIPLDPDTIGAISRQLEDLAKGMRQDSPADRRGTAQILALSLALDPGNQKARDLLEKFKDSRNIPKVDPGKLNKVRARLWQYATWLETPEAGSQGRALAYCLQDVLSISDPKDPRSTALRKMGERGAWQGWIPAISAYQTKIKPVADNPEEKAEPETPSPATGQPLLAKAEVKVMLWQKIKKGESTQWRMAPAPLKMTARLTTRDSEEKHREPITIGSNRDRGTFDKLNGSILKLLRKEHDSYPKGLRISITGEELEASLEAKRHQSLSAAVAVLANSALTGREPQGIIIGQMQESGEFKPSTGLWSQLRSLGKGQGDRLVLPIAASSELPSLLALEQPEFFLEHEVLLASDFKGLVEMTLKVPDSPLAEASSKFQEIRARLGNQDLRQYIANRFIRQRLTEILQEYPGHYSSRMLLTQSSGNRPTVVTRRVLAAELKRAIQPAKWLLKSPKQSYSSSEVGRIDDTYDLCREQIDGMERYAEKKDDALVELTRDFVICIRNLDRAARSRGESDVVAGAVSSASGTLIKRHKELITALDRAEGNAKSP